MRLLIITLALSSLLLGMSSCAKGGNIDRGNDGNLGGKKDNNAIVTTDDDFDMIPDNDKDNSIKGRSGNDNDITNRNDRAITDGDSIIGDDDSNDDIAGRVRRGLESFEPEDLVPEGIRRELNNK